MGYKNVIQNGIENNSITPGPFEKIKKKKISNEKNK